MDRISLNETTPSRSKSTILEKIAGVTILVEYFLCYNNFDWLHRSWLNHTERFRWLDIQNSYFWNTPEIFFAIMIAWWISGSDINIKNRFLLYLKTIFPEISSALIGVYYTLWETVIPQLLPWTPDIKDVPCVIATCIASPILAKYLKRNREKILHLLKTIT